MSVTAVVPNWNGAAVLPKLFASLNGQGFSDFIVVDNGSQDGSAELAERHGARVIRLDGNEGFAAAVNRGVAAAAADYVCILNNDVELTSGWLRLLLGALEAPDVWFAVGKVLSSADRQIIDGSFDLLSRAGCAWRAGAGRPDRELWNRPRKVCFPPLTAAVLRRELFLRVGALDERFGSYLEDVEFGLRCASMRYSGIYVPDAVAYHIGSATLGRWHPATVRQIARNQVLLVARHYSAGLLRECGWAIAVGQLLWGVVAARHGQAAAWIGGKAAGVRLFRSCRGPGDAAVREILLESEQELRTLQRDTGYDWYWRLYFALT